MKVTKEMADLVLDLIYCGEYHMDERDTNGLKKKLLKEFPSLLIKYETYYSWLTRVSK